MKFRNYFVSNSSSTNFIVKFPFHVSNKEDIENLLNCSDIEASYIFREIERWRELNPVKEIFKSIYDGFYYYSTIEDFIDIEDIQQYINTLENPEEMTFKDLIERVIYNKYKITNDEEVCVLKFEDDTEYEAYMERNCKGIVGKYLIQSIYHH